MELTLQSRPKTADDSGIWSNASDGDGNEVKRVKYGFAEEELAAWDVNATVPKYGMLGRELEYRWVETAVYQYTGGGSYTEETLKEWYEENENKENLLETVTAETGLFKLQQNGREVQYQSTTTANGNGDQTITNELKDTVNYNMEKQWLNGLQPDEVSFSVFQIPSGGTLDKDKLYVTFTMNRDGSIKEFHCTRNDAVQVGSKANGNNWKALVSNLPEFDEQGAEYQYVLLEDTGDIAWTTNYENKRVNNGDYMTIVQNIPPPAPGQRIMVRKEWVDGSDTAHREPVTVEVWKKGDSTGPLATTILSSENEWSQLVGIGENIKPEDVYIKETEVGKEGNTEDVSYDENADFSNPVSVIGEYSSAYHNYEVTYTEMQQILGENVFTVRNRRVNTVNFTATKLWKDNNGMLRKQLQPALEKLADDKKITLSLRLKFVGDVPNGYNITGNGPEDTVSVGLDPEPILNKEGKPTSSVQEITFGGNDGVYSKKSEDHFWNRRKYDFNGAVVHLSLIHI